MMTREESKINNVSTNQNVTSYGHELIDKIYDDFESRTCENCKYYDEDAYTYNDHMGCQLFYVEAQTSLSILDGFGCNKFERKTDGNV